MTDLHISVNEWNEESKQAKLARVRCPKGHFISWKTYNPISKVDQEGNPAYPDGTFCCNACSQYYNVRRCSEMRR